MTAHEALEARNRLVSLTSEAHARIRSDGRFLRIDDADTSKPVIDEPGKPVTSKPCIVPACSGTMHFHERRDVADAPHTLEWPWYASWQCSEDSTHVQLVTHSEEPEI